jgi:hypothetical protein
MNYLILEQINMQAEDILKMTIQRIDEAYAPSRISAYWETP